MASTPSPAETPKLPPQLQAARQLIGGREIDAVVVTVGANDIGFSGILRKCATSGSYCGELGQNELQKLLTAEHLAQIQERMRQLPAQYAQLRNCLQATGIGCKLNGLAAPILAVPNGRTYIAPYPDPTRKDDTGLSSDYCKMVFEGGPLNLFTGTIWPSEAMWGNLNVIQPLNGYVRQAAIANGWEFIDGIYEAFRLHGYCVSGSQNWIRSQFQSKTLQGDEHGTFHPNFAGQGTYASFIFSHLRADLYPSGVPRPPR